MDYLNDFPILDENFLQKQKIKELAESLEFKTKLISRLLVEKEQDEEQLRLLVGHDKAHEGRISYECDEYNIRITTGWNWSFDKKEYEIMKSHIPQCFNPVVQKIEYKLDKDILRDIETYSSGEEREMLFNIFSKKEKKMNVIVEAKKR